MNLNWNIKKCDQYKKTVWLMLTWLCLCTIPLLLEQCLLQCVVRWYFWVNVLPLWFRTSYNLACTDINTLNVNRRDLCVPVQYFHSRVQTINFKSCWLYHNRKTRLKRFGLKSGHLVVIRNLCHRASKLLSILTGKSFFLSNMLNPLILNLNGSCWWLDWIHYKENILGKWKKSSCEKYFA